MYVGHEEVLFLKNGAKRRGERPTLPALPTQREGSVSAFDIDEPPADDGGSCTGGSSSSSRQQRLRRRPRSELSGQTTTESSDSDNPSKRFKKVTWLKEARSVRWLLVSFVRWWFRVLPRSVRWVRHFLDSIPHVSIHRPTVRQRRTSKHRPSWRPRRLARQKSSK